MTVGQNKQNETNKSNPLIDTGNVTVNAFNAIRKKEEKDQNFLLGRDDSTVWKSPNFKVKVKAWTQVDNKTHTYFHSLSIDVNVEDFMGTAELKCPYDSDLMSYWEPIRQTVVIYGSNRGDYKILFIGRVRGVKQDGYELVIEFQNYAWKFKQLVPQSYSEDNVFNKDGYTILRLMFEALKIDSWVISPSAKNRLKQVGIDQDGNLTMNGKEIEEMPDLFKRIEESNPSKVINKNTLNNKLREKYLHNIKNINYTLKYEKPTKKMQKIASQGNYTAGNTVYSNPYGSASGSSGGATGADTGALEKAMQGSANCSSPPAVNSICPSVPSSLWNAIQTVYLFNRDCVNDYSSAKDAIVNFASNTANTYFSNVESCLATMAKYTTRKDGRNAASDIQRSANAAGRKKQVSNVVENPVKAATDFISGGWKAAGNLYNAAKTEAQKFMSNPIGYSIGVGQTIWKGIFGG